MNILIVSEFYPSTDNPQNGIYIEQQAKALLKLGHLVEVIVTESSCYRNVIFKKSVLSGITIYRCQYYNLYKEIYSNVILYLNIRKFKKLINFSQYDVISIHMFKEYTLRIFIHIARKYKLKLILHYHGLSILYDNPLPLTVRLLNHRGNLVLKRLISKADAFVGVSDKVCDRIREHTKGKPVYTVYNGVDTALFYPSSAKTSEAFTILNVAGLKKIKGNHYLISAVRQLCKKHRDKEIRLILVGKGQEEASLRNQIKMLHMEKQVEMTGLLPYEEVAELMRQCDVFAMPSYYEALGCAYLEAMACRLPVIGCRNQGIDEVIIDGENGLLVEPHNILDLSGKLEYLLQNTDKSKEIAENGYHTVINQFTWEDSAISLTKVYQSACKS